MKINYAALRRLEAILFIIVIASGFIVVLNLYITKGVSWDFIAHYLNAETLLRQGFYSHIVFLGNSTVIENNGFYFEAARAPAAAALMAILIASTGRLSIPFYIAALFALLGAAIWITSKKLGITPLLGASLLVSPYLLLFTFLFNSTEILSLIFVMLTLAFVAEKRSSAGIFMALAGMAKYTSLIFLPLLLLLGKPKKIFYSAIYLIAVTLPWIVFNYVFFGNPIYSYYKAIIVAVASTHSSFLSIGVLETLLSSLILPVSLLALFVIVKKLRDRKHKTHKKSRKHTLTTGFLHSNAFLLVSFISLGFVDLFILGLHNQAFDQERFGYFFYAAAALIVAFGLSRNSMAVKFRMFGRSISTVDITPYLFFAVAMFFIVSLYYVESMSGFSWMAQGSNNAVFGNAIASIKTDGLYGCRFVSNGWIYLKFYGIHAFSPFYYNSSIDKYPIILFNNIGVPPGTVHVPYQSATQSYGNYSIVFPKGYICSH